MLSKRVTNTMGKTKQASGDGGLWEGMTRGRDLKGVRALNPGWNCTGEAEEAARIPWDGRRAQSTASRGMVWDRKWEPDYIGTLGPSCGLWFSRWVKRAATGAFWAAKRAHACDYVMGLGFELSVVPRTGEAVVMVKTGFALDELTVYWRIQSLVSPHKGTWEQE